MIHYVKGNLLESDAQALVNTVNTVGVMGKGIALQFKEAFPENFRVYYNACHERVAYRGCAGCRGLQHCQRFQTHSQFPNQDTLALPIRIFLHRTRFAVIAERNSGASYSVDSYSAAWFT